VTVNLHQLDHPWNSFYQDELVGRKENEVHGRVTAKATMIPIAFSQSSRITHTSLKACFEIEAFSNEAAREDI